MFCNDALKELLGLCRVKALGKRRPVYSRQNRFSHSSGNAWCVNRQQHHTVGLPQQTLECLAQSVWMAGRMQSGGHTCRRSHTGQRQSCLVETHRTLCTLQIFGARQARGHASPCHRLHHMGAMIEDASGATPVCAAQHTRELPHAWRQKVRARQRCLFRVHA